MGNEKDKAQGMKSQEKDRSRASTADLEAKLKTYQNTLKEIYQLYDKKIEELSLIRRLGDSIRTPLDLETLCRQIVTAVSEEITVDRLALFLVDPKIGDLLIRASYDAGSDQVLFFSESEAESLPADFGPLGRAVQLGEPILLEQTTGIDDPLSQDDELPVSLVFLPLVARREVVGVLSLSRPAAHPFSQDEIRILTIISDQSATAVANVELFNELKASESQARQTSLFLENLFETANDVVFILNESGNIRYVNRKISEWGHQKEDLVGGPFSTLFADPADKITETLLNDRTRKVIEAAILTGEGKKRDVLFSTSHMEADQGRDPAWLVLGRDITERKQLERQLFHSEKLASIGILAAGVAHEVGNPLSAISGYTQILQSGGATEAETREYLAAIEDQTRRIQRIIQDLLNFSRPSTGHRSDVVLGEAIPQIMSMMETQKAFRKIKVTYDLDPTPAMVNMDRDHLAQVIVNMTLNAAQAMSEGGSLTIRVRSGDQAVIRLEDTGPGVPTESAKRVFDPFFTTKPVGQGTGLGLAICHRIIESYNGSIELDPQAGPGATFIIKLPTANTERTVRP